MGFGGRARLGLFAGVGVLVTSGLASPSMAATPPRAMARPALRVQVTGRNRDGTPKLSGASPTGLSPQVVEAVYGLRPGPTSGAGQTIAIVDAFHDPNALSDLNKFSSTYGLPTCTTSTCFSRLDPQGTPPVDAGWALEESLDIEWAHAEAPGARIVLVEAASASLDDLTSAVAAANRLGATEVSMSWGGVEFSSETSFDSTFTRQGTLYTASSGDSGTGPQYPASSPNIITVGGTTLNGCAGSAAAPGCLASETAWSGSGGGVSAFEPPSAAQAGYTGKVSGASSMAALDFGRRATPDVSFAANPSTGVSVYDSTRFQTQAGWFTLGGTSVGSPNWAGILAAGATGGSTNLQGAPAIYTTASSSSSSTFLRDITAGSNGACLTGCSAGPGYDLVTGLGSPINYS